MDYFLANDIYHTWRNRLEETYKACIQYIVELWRNTSEKFLHILPKMEADDWLFNYRYDWGIKYSLQNVLNKARYLEKDIPVFNSFMEEKIFWRSAMMNFSRIWKITSKIWKFKTADTGSDQDTTV